MDGRLESLKSLHAKWDQEGRGVRAGPPMPAGELEQVQAIRRALYGLASHMIDHLSLVRVDVTDAGARGLMRRSWAGEFVLQQNKPAHEHLDEYRRLLNLARVWANAAAQAPADSKFRQYANGMARHYFAAAERRRMVQSQPSDPVDKEFWKASGDHSTDRIAHHTEQAGPYAMPFQRPIEVEVAPETPRRVQAAPTRPAHRLRGPYQF